MKIFPNPVRLLDKRKLSQAEWQAKRNTYIGASDVGTILGLNKYESPLELFHRKVGVVPPSKPENISTYSGHIMEPYIYKHWFRFYDPQTPTHDQLVRNYETNNVIRTARRRNFTLISETYPWLGCNLDYIIDPTPLHDRGCMDCKNMLQYVMNQYEGGMNPHYIAQMQAQMLVTGFKYSELFVLIDGKYPEQHPQVPNDEILSIMIPETEDFFKRVEQGKKIWMSSAPEMERLQMLTEFEPKIDGGEALDKYLKQRYKDSGKKGKKVGDAKIKEIAVEYLKANERVGQEEEVKRIYSNALRKIFIDSEVDEIVFNEKALITYRNLDGNTTLRVSKEILKLE
ncbi:MAG TPA: YqaJ viral recombinase family protein [Smithella sp.]|nr:YqaJ viral recombinase family protein [Smithella sp.]